MSVASSRELRISCVTLLAACAVLTSLVWRPLASGAVAAEPEVTRILDAAAGAPQGDPAAVETTVRPQPAAVLQATKTPPGTGDAVDYFDVKPRTVSELAIDRELQRNTEVDFHDMPLSEVAAYLQDAHHIPIVIDRSALVEMGMTGDEPITAKLQNITLRSVLNLLLRDLKLTYLVKDEVLMITSPERADAFLEARVYAFPRQSPAQMDALVKLIREMDPESWSDSGGPGYIGVYGHGLLVRQTQKVHEQIHQVLHQLQYLKEDQPAP